ncbi:MAG: hypothetical protein AAF639_41680 [Chloroflexota bacterium]
MAQEQQLQQGQLSGETTHDFSQLETYLRANLFRSTAPTMEELGDYVMGLLTPERTKEVEQYLVDFPDRQYDVNQTKAYMQSLASELPPDPVTVSSQSMVESSGNILSKAAQGVADAFRMPSLNMNIANVVSAPMAVRDGESLTETMDEPFLFEAGEMQISLSVTDDIEQSTCRSLMGLVLGEIDESLFHSHKTVLSGVDTPLDIVDPLWTAYLWRTNDSDKPASDDEFITSVMVEDENFMLSGLNPGTYHLVLSEDTANVEILVGPVQV